MLVNSHEDQSIPLVKAKRPVGTFSELQLQSPPTTLGRDQSLCTYSMVCSARETQRQEKMNLAEVEPTKVSPLQDWESSAHLPTEIDKHVVRLTYLHITPREKVVYIVGGDKGLYSLFQSLSNNRITAILYLESLFLTA